MIANPQLNHTKKIAEQIHLAASAIASGQAVEVSIPEDVQALGRLQMGPGATTTPQPPTQAPLENKAGLGSRTRPRSSKAGPGPA